MSPENIVAIATGTTGLTAFLIYAVRLLWISHERSDADMRATRDLALKGWQDQTAAIEKLVNVLKDQVPPNVLKGRPEDRP